MTQPRHAARNTDHVNDIDLGYVEANGGIMTSGLGSRDSIVPHGNARVGDVARVSIDARDGVTANEAKLLIVRRSD